MRPRPQDSFGLKIMKFALAYIFNTLIKYAKLFVYII